jgi:16S rRNA (adenine1518-N6/adenine1519-N6)-dimethyltransferase
VTLTHREITELLARHGLSPSRALGQNFVSDPNTVRRIVRLAGIGDGDPVVEIGPGVGSLTTALCEVGAEVTAIELDRHLLPVLAEVVEPLGVRVVHGDALEVDWSTLLASHPSWTLVANLPYNVATTIVLQLLDDAPAITSMLVMVQREVGERLASAPGSGTYGIPSVKLALTSTAEVVGRVPPTVFIPQPRVESALVRITRRPEPVVSVDHDELMTLVRTAFGQRRKMLRRSLSALVTPEQFERAGVAPDDRPEQLGVMQWDALTAAVLADR